MKKQDKKELRTLALLLGAGILLSMFPPGGGFFFNQYPGRDTDRGQRNDPTR